MLWPRTDYFKSIRTRPDRAIITDEWILFTMEHPEGEAIQQDGRIRRWAKVGEKRDRFLRVILLADSETVHNAFFDRRYKP